MRTEENNQEYQPISYHTVHVEIASTSNPFFQLDGHRLASLEAKLNTRPKILSKTAGRDTCSIFKVPQNFIDVNGKHYHPHTVSIGPFHHNKPHLRMIQEHKYSYLSQLLTRTQLTLPHLFNTVSPLESAAREYYSEAIPLDSHDFLEIMVVDGCFILELLRKVGDGSSVQFEYDDPLASMSWMLPFLLRDLLRLENQIPFFILHRLFETTRSESQDGLCQLSDLCFELFCYEEAVDRPKWVIERMRGYQARHLLDLLRTSFIPVEEDMIQSRGLGGRSESTPSHVIHCASKLRHAGIKIRPPRKGSYAAEAGTFLAVSWLRCGVIEMPMVTIDDFMTSFLGNCVAYELCQKNSCTYFTTYTTLLDCLVNTSKDVGYLCDHNIIENYYGTDSEVATYLNNIGKDMAFDIDKCYLAKLFNDVNQYYEKDWNVTWASFKSTYFNTPWSFISALAAFVLLVISILQTVYTVLPYYDLGPS